MDRARDWPVHLDLDPTAFIAPGAVVVGEVRLGPRSSVWFNTVVRGDTAPIAIGEGSNIQDGSVVHVDAGMPAVVGDRVTVGHRAVVHGCTIEDDCLIGMGAMVLSGARIGRGSLIGAGSLILEGRQIPPESVVLGAPGRVVGSVQPAHREAIRHGSEHYAELSRTYLARGFAVPHPLAREATGHSARERPPLTWLEWGQLLATLAETPSWVEQRRGEVDEDRWRQPPGLDRWSALEVVCHLRDADREICLPRLERMLSEEHPVVPDVDVTGWARTRAYATQSWPRVREEWRASRAALLSRLAPLGPQEWKRLAFHSVRGPFPLGEMVRYWVDHDLSHRLQIALAIGPPA